MMKKSGKQVLLFGGILIVAFAVWTALIQMVDVQPLGQNGTNIGFATFNCWLSSFGRCQYDNLYDYRLDGTYSFSCMPDFCRYWSGSVNKEKKSLQSGSRYHYPWSLLCCRDTGIFDFWNDLNQLQTDFNQWSYGGFLSFFNDITGIVCDADFDWTDSA